MNICTLHITLQFIFIYLLFVRIIHDYELLKIKIIVCIVGVG